MQILVLLILCLINSGFSIQNNVCPTFDDYYSIRNNSRCWYDPAAELNAPQLIAYYGYPVIEYDIPTEDGFILKVFRIPSKSNKHPVYLQHGLVSTCDYFIGIGKDSLPFLLADAGYDVWLGNYRGNLYSEQHMNLTVFDNEYWEHSMDEIVQYDFPAIFNTILHYTNKDNKIIYIGHSLGTTLGLMFSAKYPIESRRILKIMILMSPAYTLSNMLSPYKVAAPFGAAIVNTVRDLGMYRIVSQAEPLRELTLRFCLESPPLMRLCLQLYNLFYGPNALLGAEKVPVYFNQLPGGTALRILNHAADLVLGNFRHYNFIDKNYYYYGTPTPPIYDIKNIHVPVHLIYSTQDWATTENDARNLFRNLPPQARFGIRRIDIPKFNHIDFVYANQAKELVYNDIIKLLNKFINY